MNGRSSLAVQESSQVRTVCYDIETAPNRSWTWGKYQQDVLRFDQEWYILCFAYRFLDDDEATVVSLPDFKKAYKEDPTNDYYVVKKLHEIFSEASIVIGHNSNSFDNKKSNARFLVHGFEPPRPYQSIDTCLTARRFFNFNSNRLGDLGETLGLGSKAETGGFGLWLSCMAGDKAAWRTMTAYCGQDVDLLHAIYLRLRPWIDGHPNVAFLNGDMDACPKCGAKDSMSRQGYKYNRTTTRQQWKCSACGGWSSSRVSEKVPQPSLVN